MADAISYTAATGKRPEPKCDKFCNPYFEWGYEGVNEDFPELDVMPDAALLPEEVFYALPDDPRCDSFVVAEYPTEAAALAAADAAYLKAVADGAMEPITEGVA